MCVKDYIKYHIYPVALQPFVPTPYGFNSNRHNTVEPVKFVKTLSMFSPLPTNFDESFTNLSPDDFCASK